MNSSNGPWPPLIVATHVPRFVKWRDILLTLVIWGCFAVLLDKEYELFLDDYLEPLGLDLFDTYANWPEFFDRLMPFLLTAAILGGLLVIFSLRTLRRRSRGLLLPKPAPLETAHQAHHAGLNEAELIDARSQRIVIVHIDTNGRHRIEAPHGR
jgi:hypothetical protein